MIKILSALVLTLSISGCATLFGEKDRSVRIESEPPGAKVTLNGIPMGKTPTVIQIQSMTNQNMVTVDLKGYEPISMPVMTSIQPIAFLNLINIVCWGIDFATGNVFRIDTKVIAVDLDKKTASFIDGDKRITANITSSPQCAAR